MELCLPLFAFLIIMVFRLMRGSSPKSIVFGVIFTILASVIIYILCKNGGSMFAWGFVLIPLIFPMF